MNRISVNNRIFFGLALIFLLTGCGLKGNPVPPMTVASQQQEEQTLAASVKGETLVLTWQLKNPEGKLKYITIEKSELGIMGNTCKDCPRTFEKIVQLPVKDGKNEESGYTFADTLAKKGKTYTYRLKLCDEADICRESKTVEIDFK